MKSLLVPESSEIDEASEELYGISKQPAQTCPLIDGVLMKVKNVWIECTDMKDQKMLRNCVI